MARRREIELVNIANTLGNLARASVNRGLPIGNKSLSEIQARELGLSADLRRGAVKVKYYKGGDEA